MRVSEARDLILQAIENGEWIERATDYSCVTVTGVDYCDAEMFDALEQIRREGTVTQLVKSGQPLGYRDVDRFKAAQYHGSISEFVAAGLPRSKSVIEAQSQQGA